MEIFASEQDLVQRKTEMDGMANSPVFAEYSYQVGRFTLLRVSHDLIPDQAAAYRDALASLG